MPKPAHAPSPQIAHVSITLDGVVPEVSRIVAMPLGIRLHMLHLIIQAALGWTNSHLWLIHARGGTWGVPDPDFPDDTIPANRTLLLDMVADIGTNRFEYIGLALGGKLQCHRQTDHYRRCRDGALSLRWPR